MNEWQPIETAPAVCTVLVYMPEENRKFQVMYRYENSSVIGGAFAFELTKPTHWMPLPEAPTKESK